MKIKYYVYKKMTVKIYKNNFIINCRMVDYIDYCAHTNYGFVNYDDGYESDENYIEDGYDSQYDYSYGEIYEDDNDYVQASSHKTSSKPIPHVQRQIPVKKQEKKKEEKKVEEKKEEKKVEEKKVEKKAMTNPWKKLPRPSLEEPIFPEEEKKEVSLSGNTVSDLRSPKLTIDFNQSYQGTIVESGGGTSYSSCRGCHPVKDKRPNKCWGTVPKNAVDDKCHCGLTPKQHYEGEHKVIKWLKTQNGSKYHEYHKMISLKSLCDIHELHDPHTIPNICQCGNPKIHAAGSCTYMVHQCECGNTQPHEPHKDGIKTFFR